MIHLTYFVHGTTADNENHISSGWNDVGLSELGINQSYTLKEILKDEMFDVVFCSDLIRAQKTAEIAFWGKCQIIFDSRLRECNYGDYNGFLSSVVEPMQEKNILEPFPHGESYEDVKTRISDLLDFLRTEYDGKRIAFIAHKAPQLALDVLLCGKNWEQAHTDDWRKIGGWKPGWKYIVR
jgi:broad specificity phosphatase PhoE